MVKHRRIPRNEKGVSLGMLHGVLYTASIDYTCTGQVAMTRAHSDTLPVCQLVKKPEADESGDVPLHDGGTRIVDFGPSIAFQSQAEEFDIFLRGCSTAPNTKHLT